MAADARARTRAGRAARACGRVDGSNAVASDAEDAGGAVARARGAGRASTSRPMMYGFASLGGRGDARGGAGEARERRACAFESDGGRSGSGTYADVDCVGRVGVWLPYVVRFNHRSAGAAVAIGDEEGKVTVLDATRALPGTGETSAGYEPMFIVPAHENAIYDVAWTCDDARLITASADRGVSWWDVETRGTYADCEQAHTACVKAVAAHPTSAHVAVTGGRDGHLLLFDTRARSGASNRQSVSPSMCARFGHRLPGTGGWRRTSCLHSVTSVAFDSTGELILSSGGSDGLVKMWDMRHMKTAVGALGDAAEGEYVRGSFYDCGLGSRFSGGGGHQIGPRKPRGISGIALDPTSSRVVVSYIDNHMALFDSNDPKGKPLRHFVGHTSTSYYIKPCFSPDGERVACGSLDNNVHIWDVRRPNEPSIELVGHTAGVSCVHWSARFDALASCGDDGCVKLWRADPRAEIKPARRLERPARAAPSMHPAILRALGRSAPASVDETTFDSAAAGSPSPRATDASPPRRRDAPKTDTSRRRPLDSIDANSIGARKRRVAD